MATEIKATIFKDAETWITENMPYLVADNVCSISRTVFSPLGLTKYKDYETGEVKMLSMQDHVNGLRLLCEEIDNKKLFVGGLKNAIELIDAGNWDAEVVDAYRQMCFYGKVIYG